jgi:drug/metabolite transporter (DMT)-like permease
MQNRGTLLCLGSAVAFGAMAIFGKLAYEQGVDVGTLLATRFALAAGLFWALLLATGRAGEVRGVSRRDLALALALGAVGYAAQAGLFFAALTRVEASTLELLLYTFPSMVAVAAIVLGRERADRRRLAALVLASSGLVLVLAGAGTGALDPLGAVLGLAAAVVYTTYILTSEGVAGRVRPQLLSALVCTGAAVSLTAGGASLGELHPGAVTAGGWAAVAGIAVVSTVVAVSLFFAGLRRAGATNAAILATAEPVTTVVLAFLVFGEVLSGVQLAGGLLVLSSVVALNWRATYKRGSGGKERRCGLPSVSSSPAPAPR